MPINGMPRPQPHRLEEEVAVKLNLGGDDPRESVSARVSERLAPSLPGAGGLRTTAPWVMPAHLGGAGGVEPTHDGTKFAIKQ
jgi:hypothetical protein